MKMQYIDNILFELFTPVKKELKEREDNLITTAVEEEGAPFTGSTIIHYPGGYIEKNWPAFSNEWTTINMPEHLIAENNRIIKDKEKCKQLKKLVKCFLQRGFLKAETPGDLPALIPENMHIHFPPELEKEIYDSTQVLNRWAVSQFIAQEQKVIKIIRRQLLENVILRN